MSLDDLFSQIQAGNLKELNLIVKADVQGSVEAVKQSLLKLSNEEVVVKVIHGGVGAINESDVILASASNAIIIGFNVRPDATAKATAEREKSRCSSVPCHLRCNRRCRGGHEGYAGSDLRRESHWSCRSSSDLQSFRRRQLLQVLMCWTVYSSEAARSVLPREGKQIFEGELASLKRFKDDVKEVKAGYECGLVFEKFNDVQELDQVEAYTMVEVPR